VALLKRRTLPAQSGSDQQMYLPRPLANIWTVLMREGEGEARSFWDEYAHRREAGIDADKAVEQTLAKLLPSDQVDEVLAMLRGELDQQLSMIKPFDGREMKAGLIDKGDTVWHKFQALPGWPD
jgi:hypothetical protein